MVWWHPKAVCSPRSVSGFMLCGSSWESTSSSDVPNATTLLKFRHLLEEHGLGKQFFDAINRCLEQAGRMMHDGSIVDATLISAPSSTKNAEKKRDPEMHSVKKLTYSVVKP